MYYLYVTYVLKMCIWQKDSTVHTVDSQNNEYFLFRRQNREKGYTLLCELQFRLKAKLATT